LNILLVRLRLIGDVVFTTPAIRALRRRFPDAQLTYVVEPSAAPVVAHNPHLTHIIVTPHLRGWARVREDWRLARRLRAQRFDLAIDFHGGPRSAWLTRASGARRRVGYDIDGRKWMYTEAVHRPRGLHPRHSVENQWDLLRAIDPAWTDGPDPARDAVEMVAGAEADAAVAARLAQWQVPASARVIVLHVSAGNPFRRWPETAFANVVTSLVRQSPDRWVLVTSGPSDQAAASRVVQHARSAAGDAAGRVIEAGDLSLAELRALVGRAALYIGGDSGPLHVAATTLTPIVGLYGPTLAERSAPWRDRTIPVVSIDAGSLECRPCDQRVCAPGDFRCLTGISAATVTAAADRLLETMR
jgi:lipopolysaccharide heptosyltransferase II